MKLSSPLSIAPSILSADFTRLGEEVRAVTRAGAHFIHVDVMDGHFVPNLTIGSDVVAAIRRSTHLPLDVHLMIESPERFVPAFVEAGASIVTVHAEACVHLHRVLQQLRELGVKAGVSLNPATPLNVLDHILEDVDLILIMTVNPGFGGQKPIRAAIDKLAQVKARIAEAQLKDPPAVEVDGGVKVDNVQEFAAADIYVAGSGIFLWPEQIESLKKSAMSEDELAASYARVIQALQRKLREARGLQPPAPGLV
jgi:ribulose-phosphate 3-epimerase